MFFRTRWVQRVRNFRHRPSLSLSLKTIRTLGTRRVWGWRAVRPKSHGSMSQPPPRENDCAPVCLVTFMVGHRKGGCLHEEQDTLLFDRTCLHTVRLTAEPSTPRIFSKLSSRVNPLWRVDYKKICVTRNQQICVDL